VQNGMNLVVGFIAVAFGVFTAVSPARAAEIWGAGRLSKLDPRKRSVYLFCCRIFGGFLGLAGILVVAGGFLHWD
jgi:hypothetical protein